MALRALLILFLVSASVLVAAEENPSPNQNQTQVQVPKKSKWEAGFAVGGFYLPDYPGADESRARTVPLPYMFYRGDVFRADREGGVRGRVIKKEKVEFDVSVEAAFPVDSENNQARDGMESLDWLGEVGPRLVYHIHQGKQTGLDLKLPFRYVFSTDIRHWDHRGYTVNPLLQFRYNAPFDPQLVTVAKLEGTWATTPLMDYLYSVDANEATATRPEYKAKPGYLGSTVSLSLLKVFSEHDTVIFTGVSWNVFDGAANRNSPLMKDFYTTSYYAGIAVSLYKSEEKEN